MSQLGNTVELALEARANPKNMRAEELTLPPGIGWLSWSNTGELTLVLWMWKSQQVDQLRSRALS